MWARDRVGGKRVTVLYWGKLEWAHKRGKQKRCLMYWWVKQDSIVLGQESYGAFGFI